MSLINDALKKAQRQRTGDPLSGSPLSGGSASPLSGRASAPSSGGSKQALLIGGGALLGVILAGGAFLLFRGGDQPPPAAPRQEVAKAPAPAKSEPVPSPAPAKSEPAPVVAAVKEPEKKAPPPVSLPTLARTEEPKAIASQAASSPAVSAPVLTVPISTPPAPAVAATPAPKTPGEAPRPTTRMVNTIEALRVAGIRASGNDSKVLMNDRVYRIGDMIDHDQGLKLTAATANSLTFVDSTGATYTRHF